MRKVIAAILLCCGIHAANAQFAAQWNFQDFTQNSQPVKAVYLTLIANIAVNGSTNIVVSQRQSKQTASQGQLIVSNMVYGSYRVEFIGPTRTNVFTNCFDVSITTNSLVNAADYICVGTNTTGASDYAYTRGQANARFMTNATPTVVDYVLTATDSNGHYSWQPGGGGGGGASLTTITNIANTRATAATNAMGLTSGLSAFVSTNRWEIAGAGVTAATAATNGYPWGALYDALNSALNATNNIGLGSSLSAFRTTNSFITPAQQSILSNNLNAANITVGTVPTARLGSGTANSSTFLRGDQTYATPAGGGNVSGPASPISGNFPRFNLSGGPDIIDSMLGPDDLLKVGGNLSDVADVPTARGNLGAAASALTLTINGTANQITSSAGAQDLSANRTVTLSIPSAFTAPGSITATTFFGIDQWQFRTNASTHALILTNIITGANVIAKTNGVLDVGGIGVALTNQLVSWASVTQAGQLIVADGNLNPSNTVDAAVLTNTIKWSNPGSTNLTLTFNGTPQTLTLTNAPKDVWFHFLGANGSIAVLCPTNTTLHWDYPIKWFVGMSNNVVTNGWAEFDSAGGTNYGQLWGSIAEGM